jgi:hypothetical protein
VRRYLHQYHCGCTLLNRERVGPRVCAYHTKEMRDKTVNVWNWSMMHDMGLREGWAREAVINSEIPFDSDPESA